MFISENVNVQDSALFYGFLREALLEQVNGNDEAKELIEESSDADIISYAVLGKSAPEGFDRTVLETVLMSEIKDAVLSEAGMFDDNYTVGEFIQEVSTLSGIDSKSILSEQAITPTDTPDLAGEEKIDIPDPTGTDKVSLLDRLKVLKNTVRDSEIWGKITGFVKEHQGAGKKIGAAALIAAAAFASYKIYQNYFSKAAKACAGKTGAAREACMQKAKAQANKIRANSLRKGLALSAKSSNPSKVRAALTAKINKLRG